MLPKVGSATLCSKASKEAGLVNRKVGFTPEASNRGERADSGPKADPRTDSQWARAFKEEFQGSQLEGGGYMQKRHGQR